MTNWQISMVYAAAAVVLLALFYGVVIWKERRQ